MSTLLSSLPALLPLAQAWAIKHEGIILTGGVPLSENQLTDARRAGVAQPEKIRLLRVEVLPSLENEEMKFIAKQIGLFSTTSVGLTLGYGIYLRHDHLENRYTLVHECVHVGQYEKRNGIGPFLSEYLRECIDPGYPFGSLEQEAILVAKDICKSAGSK